MVLVIHNLSVQILGTAGNSDRGKQRGGECQETRQSSRPACQLPGFGIVETRLSRSKREPCGSGF